MVLSSDNSQKALINPVERPEVTSQLSENVILTTVDDLYNWARLSSLWPLLFGTACCFIEFAALIGSRFDFDRFGLVPRSSPASRLDHHRRHNYHEVRPHLGAAVRTNAGTQIRHRDGRLHHHRRNVQHGLHHSSQRR